MRSPLTAGHQTGARPTFTETSETHQVDTAARPWRRSARSVTAAGLYAESISELERRL